MHFGNLGRCDLELEYVIDGLTKTIIIYSTRFSPSNFNSSGSYDISTRDLDYNLPNGLSSIKGGSKVKAKFTKETYQAYLTSSGQDESANRFNIQLSVK